MGAGGVKNFSVGICHGAPSTAHSSCFFFVDNFIIAQEMCELSTQTQEIINWIHDKVICCGIRLYAADYTRQLKLCTKLHNTDPDICDL